jgi:hypothetical protein
MKTRLYAVLPDLPSARHACDDLMAAGVAWSDLHCLGPRDAPLTGLHEAGPLQKTDVAHALSVGGYLGLLGGLALGVYLWLHPIGVHAFGAPTLAACAAGGALFGAWAASLVGISAPNCKLRPFDAEFAAGHILLMADVPAARAAEVRALLLQRHPATLDTPAPAGAGAAR